MAFVARLVTPLQAPAFVCVKITALGVEIILPAKVSLLVLSFLKLKTIFFIVRTCDKLPVPAFGQISCVHADLGITYNSSVNELPVDTVCTFKCDKGRTLIGSRQRTCLPLARWDGLRTSCKRNSHYLLLLLV